VIPGLGSGERPEMLDESYVDEVVMVEEADTIRACHQLARRGFLFGGSTGTVVSGAASWLARNGSADVTAVAIAPDLGERYLDTVYQTNWLEDLFGKDVLAPVQDAQSFPESLSRPAGAGADPGGSTLVTSRPDADVVQLPLPRSGS
jgi:cysteine synthase A